MIEGYCCENLDIWDFLIECEQCCKIPDIWDTYMFKRFVYQCSHNEPNELTQCVFQGLEVSNTSHLVSNERRNSDVAFKQNRFLVPYHL